MEGGASRWNFTAPDPASFSLTYKSKALHSCAHTYSIYSMSSMLILTQVWTNFLVPLRLSDGAKLVLSQH